MGTFDGIHWQCLQCGAIGPEYDGNWRWNGSIYEHKCEGLMSQASRFDAELLPLLVRQEIANLLVDMKEYVSCHENRIGECVAWSKLKEMFNVDLLYKLRINARSK